MSDEQVVQLQHRLTAALQELSNLERFTKQQQHVSGDVDKRLHNLLQEEAYLTERLLLVKKVRARVPQASHQAILCPTDH